MSGTSVGAVRYCVADVVASPARRQPAAPAAVVLPLDGSFAARAEAGLRLWCAMTGRARGRPPDDLTEQQRSRLGLALRGLDGRLAGFSYRVIAQALFSQTRVLSGPDWKTHDLRYRTIRLCCRGIELMHGGYLRCCAIPAGFDVESRR